MEILEYPGKYLPKVIVEATFRKGQITRVDKTLCGNGFTTAFLQISPEPGKLNILIEPNSGVISDKQKSNKLNNIEFRHQNGSHFGPIRNTTKLVVTTPDTFLKLITELKGRGIDKICIDEVHAFAQQSSFRMKLKGFIPFICKEFQNSSIVTVTATPFVHSKIDITLFPIDPPDKINIEINNNMPAVIEEIKTSEAPVVIFSNSKKVLMNLRERDKEEKAFIKTRLMTGTTLLWKILKEIKILPSENRFFGSVKAFEGLDLEFENATVFVIQDLNSEAEQFDLTNIIQAINRLRKSPKKVCYSRIDKTEGYPNIYKVLKKVNNMPEGDRGSRSKLKKILAKQELKVYLDCLFWTYDEHKPIMNIDYETVASHYNKHVTISKGIHDNEFANYLDRRGIRIRIIQPTQQKIKNLRTRNEQFYIRENVDFVYTYKLNEQPFFYYSYKPDIDNFYRQFKTYLEYRNVDDNYAYSPKEQLLLELKENLGSYIEDHVRKYQANKRKDIRSIRGTKKSDEINEKISKYRDHALRWWLMLLADLVNTPIEIRSQHQKHHRCYGYFTEMPMDAIFTVTGLLDLPCYEFDIKSCAIRILYNLENKPLPSNIYGDNKQNKRALNIAINSISKQQAGRTPIRTYRNNIYNRLLRYNVQIAKSLIDKYFDKSVDEVHLVTTYHEKRIIEKLRDEVFNGDGFRRHDSLILFREPTRLELKRLEQFEYLGFGGYFEIPDDLKINDRAA
ncbi:hypothetical protein [Gilvibacter sp.]|uniref:hypothetical protein n=1 Tax=Gilvibacter sp. TaxID=2729997 RepID=UPI003B52CD63